MAETVKDFPADDNGDFKEQMREFGSDAGTFLRVIFTTEAPLNSKGKTQDT